MAIKRRRSVLRGGESTSEASQDAKRARMSEENEGREQPEPLLTQEDDVSELEDNEEIVKQEEPNQEEEDRFERENAEKILEKVQKAEAKAHGSVAEMGIIEKLELHQFMCHRFLVFDFGAQINFVIGHNGSGKSAVLSALTVALGGKATVTGRGSGLKSFIQEGQSIAEVTVTIKNQGEDAYKHDVYGDSIIITRKFTKEGTSTYKIASKLGKTISAKKEDLSAICDHMNIQVDNPMNILTQDSARQFLSASTPADKYKFFLRGTQLSQLSDEYSTCLENISQTQRVLKNKAEIIPDLQRVYDEAIARFKEAQKTRETQNKIDDLKREMAWAHVAAKEEQLREKLEEVEKLKRRLPKFGDEIAKTEESLRTAEEEVAAAEEEITRLGNQEHLNQQYRDIKDKQKENKDNLLRLKNDEKALNENIINLNAQISSTNERIEQEQRRQVEDTQGKRDETRRQLEHVQEQYSAAQEHVQFLEAEMQKYRDEGKKTEADLAEAKRASEQIKHDITGAEEQLRHIAQREKSKLAPFGHNVEQVLAEVEQTQWTGDRPVGPLGRFVKVRDPNRWANVMRVMLGNLMSAFAVTTGADRKTLEQILRRHGNNHPNIIIAPRDIFDYSSGEPPENYLTVLRALEVSDGYALRVLINSNSIERILLAPTRKDGDDLLRQLERGGVAWTADMYNVQRFSDGGGRSSLLPQLNRNGGDSRLQLFTTDDLNVQKLQCERAKADAEQAYQAKFEEQRALQQTISACKREYAKLEQKQKQTHQSIRQLKSKRDQLQEEINEDMPVEIQGLQSHLQELGADKKMQLVQFAEIAEKVARCNKTSRELQDEMKEVKKKQDRFDELLSEKKRLVEDAAHRRVTAQHNLQHFQKKLLDEKTKVTVAQEAADVLALEFADWTKKAEEYCERIPNPRKVVEIEVALESTKRALEKQRKKDPISIDDIVRLVKDRKDALHTAKSDLKQMVALNKSLKKSIKTRLQRWHEFRRHIALRCKMYFSYHLSRRGYYGKVIFDHVKGALELKVQTDDLAGTQGTSREKDPKSLSGGEKSFSTICLLLSLWESIGCPIRCLDEFDVFMDAVNRRISMKMMIDTANASDRKQYILITPQDMSNVQITPSVRVHRMTDPERGQGVLAFSGS